MVHAIVLDPQITPHHRPSVPVAQWLGGHAGQCHSLRLASICAAKISSRAQPRDVGLRPGRVRNWDSTCASSAAVLSNIDSSM